MKNKKLIIISIAAAIVLAVLFLFVVSGNIGGKIKEDPDRIVSNPTETADAAILQEKQIARFVHMAEDELLREFGDPKPVEEGEHTVFLTGDVYPYKLFEVRDEDSYTYSFMFIDGALNNYHVSTSGNRGIPYGGDVERFLAGLGIELGPDMSIEPQTEWITVCRNVNEGIEHINIDFSNDGNFVYNLFFMLDSAKF